jgi:hypothetical protein
MQIAGLTDHARVRMQQRGIPPTALECLLDYGRVEHDHRGAAIVYLDKAARRRLAREQGAAVLKQLGKRLGAYAVLGTDGTVMTVGHRYKRIWRR